MRRFNLCAAMMMALWLTAGQALAGETTTGPVVPINRRVIMSLYGPGPNELFVMTAKKEAIAKHFITSIDEQYANFFVRPGLAGTGGVSFESKMYKGQYLHHSFFRLKLDPLMDAPDPALFREDATFFMVTGLADPNLVSFRSKNYQTYYLRQRTGEIWLDEKGADAQYCKDATFKLVVYPQ